jgi:hypothetical protein
VPLVLVGRFGFYVGATTLSCVGATDLKLHRKRLGVKLARVQRPVWSDPPGALRAVAARGSIKRFRATSYRSVSLAADAVAVAVEAVRVRALHTEAP